MKCIIRSNQIKEFNNQIKFSFPKYVTQLINWANQNAQGTRPKTVGQLSDMFPQFENECEEITINAWMEWYSTKKPEAINNAVKKITNQISNLQEAIKLIDEKMITDWVEDLLFNKTYIGLYTQEAILAYLSKKSNTSYRMANSEEESRGIDGFIGDTPYQVKPVTYKIMNPLQENIPVKIIYYEKIKGGWKIEINE